MAYEVVGDLRAHGYRRVAGPSSDEVDAANAHLLAAQVYDRAHVPQTARNENRGPVPRAEATGDTLCVHTWDAVRAPHLFEMALSYSLVAAEYLRIDCPVAYSSNAFWTRPSENATRPDIQEFHCDVDDERFLALFVYLTDVFKPQDGPHQIFGPNNEMNTIYGPAGTTFLADTSRMHRGIKPRSRERGIWWWRWGVSLRPAANTWDKIESLPRACLGDGRYPQDAALRESIRLLVSP